MLKYFIIKENQLFYELAFCFFVYSVLFANTICYLGHAFEYTFKMVCLHDLLLSHSSYIYNLPVCVYYVIKNMKNYSLSSFVLLFCAGNPLFFKSWTRYSSVSTIGWIVGTVRCLEKKRKRKHWEWVPISLLDISWRCSSFPDFQHLLFCKLHLNSIYRCILSSKKKNVLISRSLGLSHSVSSVWLIAFLREKY